MIVLWMQKKHKKYLGYNKTKTIKGPEFWAIMSKNSESFEMLAKLAETFDFKVLAVANCLVAFGGIEDEFIRNGFLPYEFSRSHDKALTILKPTPLGCKMCRNQDDCRPADLIYDLDVASGKLSEMGELLRLEKLKGCSNVCKPGEEHNLLTAKAFTDLGCTVITTPRVLCEEVTTEDVEMFQKLKDCKTFEELNVCSRSWVNEVIRNSFPSEKMSVYDLSFTGIDIRVNQFKNRVRGLYAGSKAKEANAYRKSHCRGCLYTCEKPPWNKKNPNSLTHERIMDEFRPDEQCLKWMSLFTITGIKEHFKNPNTGRKRLAISVKPVLRMDWDNYQEKDVQKLYVKEMGFEIKALSSPYDNLGVCDLFDYKRIIKLEPEAIEGTEEQLAYLNYALHALCELTRNNEAGFYVSDRPLRNDILFIKVRRVYGKYEIVIGSDTRAKIGYGETRPRFRTNYTFPYADDIYSFFRRFPFAC